MTRRNSLFMDFDNISFDSKKVLRIENLMISSILLSSIKCVELLLDRAVWSRANCCRWWNAQVCIFVKSVSRATELDRLLRECNFPSIAIHSGLAQDERIRRYEQFKAFEKRVLVSFPRPLASIVMFSESSTQFARVHDRSVPTSLVEVLTLNELTSL